MITTSLTRSIDKIFSLSVKVKIKGNHLQCVNDFLVCSLFVFSTNTIFCIIRIHWRSEYFFNNPKRFGIYKTDRRIKK